MKLFPRHKVENLKRVKRFNNKFFGVLVFDCSFGK